jgi:hypothetical protein
MSERAVWARVSRWARVLALGAAAALAAHGAKADPGLVALAGRAASGDLDAARALHARGPAGLSALVDAGVSAAGREETPEYRHALDLVCAQVECSSSHLFWYTDFDAARRAAEVSGRPIVVLRLLGRLDEELSCANSRYFRLLLYSDPRISGWMRDRAVLYWSSERPVPKVTVDFGDGRKLVGTITGNSIHYLLDAHGRLVDAMPGLVTPDRFLAWLQSAGDLAVSWSRLDDRAMVAASRVEHARRSRQVLDELTGELVEHGWSRANALEALGEPEEAARSDSNGGPTAAAAARLAVSKGVGERPILTALGSTPWAPAPSPAIQTLSLMRQWNARLSPESLRLVTAHAPEAARADLTAARLRLEQRLAEDGLRNEAFLHRRIHEELSRASGLWTWQELNTWAYATLFETPAFDPWLGLAPTELLGALQPMTSEGPVPDVAAEGAGTH